MIYEWFSLRRQHFEYWITSTCKALPSLSPALCLDVPSSKLKNCKANFSTLFRECTQRRMKKDLGAGQKKIIKINFRRFSPWWTACWNRLWINSSIRPESRLEAFICCMTQCIFGTARNQLARQLTSIYQFSRSEVLLVFCMTRASSRITWDSESIKIAWCELSVSIT